MKSAMKVEILETLWTKTSNVFRAVMESKLISSPRTMFLRQGASNVTKITSMTSKKANASLNASITALFA